MYKHIKKYGSTGFYSMVDRFEERLEAWAKKHGYDHVYVERSNSCVFSKSIYVRFQKDEDGYVAGTVRISDHGSRNGTAGIDLSLRWEDYRHPAECLKAVQAFIEKFEE